MIEIKNQSDKTIDIYIYGAITSCKWDENDVTFNDFKDNLEGVKGKEINLYINSPGGSVITTQGIVSYLRRIKKDNVINAYIDGLGASCASILPMVANNIYMYETSMLMVHKPWTFSYGNSNDLKKSIEVLDKIEEGVMYPLYSEKLKNKEDLEEIKNMVENETWLTAKESEKYFDIEILEDDRELSAFSDESLNFFDKFKNTPKEIKALVSKTRENLKNNKEPKNNIDKGNKEPEVLKNKQIEILRAKLNLKIKI